MLPECHSRKSASLWFDRVAGYQRRFTNPPSIGQSTPVQNAASALQRSADWTDGDSGRGLPRSIRDHSLLLHRALVRLLHRGLVRQQHVAARRLQQVYGGDQLDIKTHIRRRVGLRQNHHMGIFDNPQVA